MGQEKAKDTLQLVFASQPTISTMTTIVDE